MAYTNLADMLADLSRSKTLADQYNRSESAKVAIWDEYKLTSEERDVLKNAKDAQAIRDYLGKLYGDAQMINHW